MWRRRRTTETTAHAESAVNSSNYVRAGLARKHENKSRTPKCGHLWGIWTISRFSGRLKKNPGHRVPEHLWGESHKTGSVS